MHLAGRRVDQELYVLNGLAKLIEHGRSSIQQRAPVFGVLNPLAMTIEQAHAERALQVR